MPQKSVERATSEIGRKNAKAMYSGTPYITDYEVVKEDAWVLKTRKIRNPTFRTVEQVKADMRKLGIPGVSKVNSKTKNKYRVRVFQEEERRKSRKT